MELKANMNTKMVTRENMCRCNAETIPAAYCHFITLGCAKNEVDTDRMRALLTRAGVVETHDVARADVIIVNTCAFLETATRESIEATLEIAQARADGAVSAPIVMCGCVPSRYGEELESELSEVAAFVPAQEEDNIVSVVASVLERARRPLESAAPTMASNDEVLRTVEGASAYVKISDGCDRFCAFCAIPIIRGAYHSRDSEAICDEVRLLMEGGVREIVLIGQDTGVWGCDFADDRDLAWLLEEVSRVVRPYDGWVRVLYLQPEGMTPRLVDALRNIPEVLPYIDIPIQHCSETVLARMGRTGSEQELRELFAHLRRQIPGLVLRTTGLVGFPGETDEDVERLIRFIDEVGFDYTSVFAYSREDGTAAAAMDGQVSEDVKIERAQRLTDVAEQLGFSSTAAHLGETVDVIVDGVEQGDSGVELIGHAWFQAPDCDGAVHIESGEATVGQKVRCRIVDAFCYELVGEVVSDC